MSTHQLESLVNAAFERRTDITPGTAHRELLETLDTIIGELNAGRLRVAEKIDGEIGRLLDKARTTAGGILQSNAARLRALAQALLVDETLEGPKLHELLSRPEDEAAVPA